MLSLFGLSTGDSFGERWTPSFGQIGGLTASELKCVKELYVDHIPDETYSTSEAGT